MNLGIRHEYLRTGVKYYILARQASLLGFTDVAGVLFHHAFEFMLKERLLTKHELSYLGTHYDKGHNLVAIWRDVKEIINKKQYNKFDMVISHLNQWEKLRYNNLHTYGSDLFFTTKEKNKKLQEAISKGGKVTKPGMMLYFAEGTKTIKGKNPSYLYLCLEDMDELFEHLVLNDQLADMNERPILLSTIGIAEEVYKAKNLHEVKLDFPVKYRF